MSYVSLGAKAKAYELLDRCRCADCTKKRAEVRARLRPESGREYARRMERMWAGRRRWYDEHKGRRDAD